MLRPVVLVCFFLSGFSGLLYEVLWLRMLILIFGSTTLAVSTVLTSFMGGLALGSFLFGRFMERKKDPLFYYGLLEGIVGLYALSIPWLFSALVPAYRMIWEAFHPNFFGFTLMQFLLVTLVLVVPTTCMGATLPILSKWAVEREATLGVTIGRLYALNTFGAVLGTALSGFFLLPLLGVTRTLIIAVTVNILVSVIVLVLNRRTAPYQLEAAEKKGPTPTAAAEGKGFQPIKIGAVRAVVFGIALSGFVSMIYEVAWSRTLSLLVDSSVYGFSIMLTTFLVGIALGSYVFSRRTDTLRHPVMAWGWLQIGIGILAFLCLLLFQELPYGYLLLYRVLGQSVNWLLAGKFLLAFCIMLAPTLCMGALFPLTIRIYGSDLGRVSRLVGNIYTVNTIGCILGSFTGGFFLIPLLGIRNTLLLGMTLNLLMGLVVLSLATVPRPAWKWVPVPTVLSVLLLILIFPPAWKAPLMVSGIYIYAHHFPNTTRKELLEMYDPKQEPLLYYKEGHTCTISVHRSQRTGAIYMKSNGKVEASSKGDMPTQVLVGQIPMLLAPRMDEVLVVGMGSGVTVGSVTPFPARKITVVELEQAVIEASRYFDFVNNRPLEDPRLRLQIADARNYLLVTPDRFDVIISEPSNPWMAGVANVFTREFFRLGYEKLKPEGVFCQWLQLYKISPESFKTVMTTFQAVFPYVYVFKPQEKDLVMVGFKQKPEPSRRRIAERMHREAVLRDLRRVGVEDLEDLLSRFVMGPEEVRQVIRGGRLNTDDNALIEFSTPKTLFAETEDLNEQILEPYRRPAEHYFHE